MNLNLKSTPLSLVAAFAGCLFAFVYGYSIRESRRRRCLAAARGQQQPAAVMRNYFCQQIRSAEGQLAANNIDVGLQSLANGITMCSRPVLLLNQLRLIMPAAKFDRLIAKLLELGYARPFIDELAGGDHIRLHTADARPPSIAGIRFN